MACCPIQKSRSIRKFCFVPIFIIPFHFIHWGNTILFYFKFLSPYLQPVSPVLCEVLMFLNFFMESWRCSKAMISWTIQRKYCSLNCRSWRFGTTCSNIIIYVFSKEMLQYPSSLSDVTGCYEMEVKNLLVLLQWQC